MAVNVAVPDASSILPLSTDKVTVLVVFSKTNVSLACTALLPAASLTSAVTVIVPSSNPLMSAAVAIQASQLFT